MMSNSHINQIRMDKMTQYLKKELSPISLKITDESHLHAGHVGAQSGKGHFSLEIVSTAFTGLTAIKKHQLIYQALANLMESDIHALSIKADAPS